MSLAHVGHNPRHGPSPRHNPNPWRSRTQRTVTPWFRPLVFTPEHRTTPRIKDENGNQVIVVPHDAGAGRERGRRHLEVELKRRCDEHVLQS